MSKAFSKEIEEYRKFYAENKDIIRELNQRRQNLRKFVFYDNSPNSLIQALYTPPFSMEKVTELCDILQIRKNDFDLLVLGIDKIKI